jgi:hypothetical protein
VLSSAVDAKNCVYRIVWRENRVKVGRNPGHGAAVLTPSQRREWLEIFTRWEREYPALGDLVRGADPRFPNIARLEKPIECGLMLRCGYEVLGSLDETDPAASARERRQLEAEHPSLTRLHAMDHPYAARISVFKALGMGLARRLLYPPPMAYSVYDVPEIADFLHDQIWGRKTGKLTADEHRLLLRDILLAAHPHAIERLKSVLASSEDLSPTMKRNALNEP